MWLVPTSTFAVSKTNIKQIFNFRGVQIPISAVFRLRLVIGYKIQGCSGAGTRCDAVPTNILALRHIVGHRWNTNTEAFRRITSYSLGWPSISLFSGPNCPQTRDLASKISENFSGVTPGLPQREEATPSRTHPQHGYTPCTATRRARGRKLPRCWDLGLGNRSPKSNLPLHPCRLLSSFAYQHKVPCREKN